MPQPSGRAVFEVRYNNRKDPRLFRETLTRLAQSEATPYQQLTA